MRPHSLNSTPPTRKPRRQIELASIHSSGTLVHLLAHEPDLARGIPPEDLEAADKALLTYAVAIRPGPVKDLQSRIDRSCGMLMLDGLLMQTVQLKDGVSSAGQLFGRGDLIFGAQEDAVGVLVPPAAVWTALNPVKVAVLGANFLMAVRHWPQVAQAMFHRVGLQADQRSTQMAAWRLIRVDERVHAVMSLLAERMGQVTPDGTLIPVRLTHRQLAELVGACRPTVTTALKRLASRGMLTQDDERGWLLKQPWPLSA